MLWYIFYRDIRVLFTTREEEIKDSAGQGLFDVSSQNNKICPRIATFEQQ